ncbi:DUF6338 family protein [Nocardia cyriacigeorgica]|uniref:DUF6338 family protein n=1 Tax=Nocardia cyriacigeorgica TaxID=135487 RepID=UPI0018960B2C|nr:DUF6338 family protein [Nocardia cyriacigeorgica]MBF6435497.1 hypothetical protein [Nocardia cyriacigeorgica]MBF6454424.1 hypothetical protein [Nocardia cyriacigeorgica]MBF6478090.1 hypothetical protein [Nocardia cyriacigeorgica]MBF6552318.1 hypothetical protein [Nocardia cyriacigeorgica]
MTPNTLLGIVAFFHFVAPGLYYDRKAARKRVKPPETTFGEISRVALVSTLCSLPAIVALGTFAAVAGRRGWTWFPDLSALFKQGNSNYYADNLIKVTVTVVLTAAVALFAAELSFRWLHRNEQGIMTFESSWREVFRVKAPAGTIAYARIGMKDGSVWSGRVVAFSRSPEVSDREIVLAPPIFRKPKQNPDGTYRPIVEYPKIYQRVILKDAEIGYIAVKYETEVPIALSPPTSEPSPPRGPSWASGPAPSGTP